MTAADDMFARLEVELHPTSPISSKITVDGKILAVSAVSVDLSVGDVTMITLQIPVDSPYVKLRMAEP